MTRPLPNNSEHQMGTAVKRHIGRLLKPALRSVFRLFGSEATELVIRSGLEAHAGVRADRIVNRLHREMRARGGLVGRGWWERNALAAMAVEEIPTPSGEPIRFLLGESRFLRLAEDMKLAHSGRSPEIGEPGEPETIAWLDQLDESVILWDIGANVGTYTLYATCARGTTVNAFEPGAANYWALNENIRVSGKSLLVRAYPLAFHDGSRLDAFHMAATHVGVSGNSVGKKEDQHGRPFAPEFTQGLVTSSVDEFIASFGVPIPNAIKIDVDGPGAAVIRGAMDTLSDPAVDTLSVELDSHSRSEVKSVDRMLRNVGFRMDDRHLRHQVRTRRFKNFHFSRGRTLSPRHTSMP